MSSRTRWAAPLAAVFLALAACGGGEEAGATLPSAAEMDPATVEALGGEENATFLDDLYREAVADGQTTITVYGVTATSSASLYEAFSERYPEITVDHVTVFGAELQNRIASEQATGQTVVDNVSVSGADAVFLADNEFLVEQTPPLAEQLDAEYQPAGNTLFGGNTYLYTIAYNTDLVAEDEVPHSLEELLDPKWAGKVAISDPTLDANGTIYAAIEAGTLDASYVDEFAATGPVISPSEREAFTAVATGQVPLGVGNFIRGEALLATDDLHVGFVSDLAEGLSTGVFYRGTVQGAPNELASNLLTSWWLTPEAQTLIAAQGQPGLMPGAAAVPGQPPLADIPRNPAPSFEEYAEYQAEGRELFATAFG